MKDKVNKLSFWYFPAILLLSLLTGSCERKSGWLGGNKLFKLMPASVTHADFVNYLDYNKQIEKKFNIYTYRNFYNGAGVALGDVNNDGLLDIFLTSNMGSNTLYLNKGDFRFEDISVAAGIQGQGQWSTGVSLTDINGDGWLDIYVCNSGIAEGDDRRNELFINNGNLTFTEKSENYGLDDPGFSTHSVFFDYDKDGDLDVYLLNNSSKAIGSFNMMDNHRMKRDSLGGDRLYRNDGGRFNDVSEEAGIYGSVIGFGLGIAVGDVNLDGWPDIYVSNDFFEHDYLYINQKDGTFRESLAQMMKSVSAASMGGDMADINNDRFLEIFTTDMVPEGNDRLKTKTTFDNWESYKSNLENGYYHQFTRNMLQLSNGDGTFSEIGRMAGVNATDWSWAALMVDLDNDGWKDIYVANGIYKDLTDQDYLQYFSNRDVVMTIVTGDKVDFKKLIDAIPSVKIPNYAYKNLGSNRFQNVTADWGLEEPGFSNGSAYGDLDNDGDLELVVNNVNMPMFIYQNNSREILPDHHYLTFELKGESLNTQAVGAKITVKHRGQLFFVEQMPIRGYLSSVDPRPHLGLGRLTTVDTLMVEWPDDRVTVLTNVNTDQMLTLHQKDAVEIKGKTAADLSSPELWFEEDKAGDLARFFHREDDFNDFEREPLMYRMMSTEGPAMCKGDMNGDKLDDLFICGAKGEPGTLLLQGKNGTFTRSNGPVFDEDRISEDTGCAMFDADNDGDLDLYVASGSNEFPESSSALSDRLYFNDGNGNLVKSNQVLPAGMYESTACVKPADFDGDGVTELFVGIRFKPFLYGAPVSGYILENDGRGNFTNVTSTLAPELLNTGMIRDMVWEDVDQDQDKDIIIVGDWMPVKVFLNENGTFREKTDAFGNEKTEGWWNCIAAADVDGDGDIDFVAGNHGLNSRFKASPEKPVEMYVNDFDNNGTAEQIICAYNGDKSYPMALKHDLTRQIPGLEKKYPKYEMYKNQQISDIFSPEQLGNAIHLKAFLLETSLFINNGKGSFTRKPLPDAAQFSPVFAVEADDLNGDGTIDLLLGGNLKNVKPETGGYDASYGTLLAGSAHGEFKVVSARESGFRVDGETRDFLRLKTNQGDRMVVARSNDFMKVFRIKAD